MFKRLLALLLVSFFLPVYTESSYAEVDNAFLNDAAMLCLETGKRNRIFPEDTQYEDLMIETYQIPAMDEFYTVWVVSTARQCSGVEFGWISIHAPTLSILQMSRTRKSYEESVHLLQWEAKYGCSYFWPADLKAQYYHSLRGEASRITFPLSTEISEAEATAIACRTLAEDVKVDESELHALFADAAFYQDDDPLDGIPMARYWGITFRELPSDGTFVFPPRYAVVIDGASGIPVYSLDYQKDLQIEHEK